MNMLATRRGSGTCIVRIARWNTRVGVRPPASRGEATRQGWKLAGEFFEPQIAGRRRSILEQSGHRFASPCISGPISSRGKRRLPLRHAAHAPLGTIHEYSPTARDRRVDVSANETSPSRQSRRGASGWGSKGCDTDGKVPIPSCWPLGEGHIYRCRRVVLPRAGAELPLTLEARIVRGYWAANEH